MREPVGHLGGDFPEVQQAGGACWTGDFQVVAIEVVELLEGLDEQVIHREPDRPTPVGIAAKQPGMELSLLIVKKVTFYAYKLLIL